MLELVNYSILDEPSKNELISYVDNEFGHIPIVNETEWAIPNWTIINRKENKIVSFYNVVEREILIDGELHKVAGINNVITIKEYRGNGFASTMLKETENEVFDKLNCNIGVLLCADELTPFYENLDWYRVECPVFFNQSSGVKMWKANLMFRTISFKLQPKEVNLNGLPW